MPIEPTDNLNWLSLVTLNQCRDVKIDESSNGLGTWQGTTRLVEPIGNSESSSPLSLKCQNRRIIHCHMVWTLGKARPALEGEPSTGLFDHLLYILLTLENNPFMYHPSQPQRWYHGFKHHKFRQDLMNHTRCQKLKGKTKNQWPNIFFYY